MILSVIEPSRVVDVQIQVETGTFTMTNLGAYGVKNFAPIVRMPQACALAIGVAEERVIPNEGVRPPL